MAYSEAQKRAVKKYMQKSYDEIKVRVAKGHKEHIKSHAKQRDESLNSL